MLANWVAWLMPHLIVKSLAFVEVMLTVWWRVLITRLLWIWMWATEVATWFLMLVSDITIAIFESANAWSIRLSSFWIYTFLPSLCFFICRIKRKMIRININ